MKIAEIGSVSQAEISNAKFDLLIAASGYESRATHVAASLPLDNFAARIALGFTDRITPQREENDRFFAQQGFDVMEANGDDQGALARIIRHAQTSFEEPRILIDFTSMTRAWYGGAIRVLRDNAATDRDLRLTFAYSPSVFTDPQAPRPNKHVGPLPGFTSLRLPAFPTALILGIGYEPERALGVVDFLEPALTFAFVADPPLDPRFTEAAYKNNAALLRRIPEERIIRYPMRDMAAGFELLRAVTQSIGAEYRTIVAPLGPKPLALGAFLAACTGLDLDVWRISPGEGGFPYDRPAFGKILGLYTRFTSFEAKEQSLEAVSVGVEA